MSSDEEHEEAYKFAIMERKHSNLARCYLALRAEIKLQREWRERAERELKEANEKIGSLSVKIDNARVSP